MAPRVSQVPVSTGPRRGKLIGLGLLLALVTLLIYQPALRGDFIWDDRPGHVTRPDLQPLAGLGRIWFELGATQQYYPVLHTAFWLEHRLWGDAPFGYHLVNVLLHVMAAGLFWTVLRRLGVPGAGIAAWLFAVHPVCVESVAWISEQKNTLSLVFYLAAGLAYLRFESDRRRGPYLTATLLFVAALLTKTVTATLPAALLVIAYWRRGRLSWRSDVQPLLPWFALALAAGLLTVWVESALIGAHGADFERSLLERGLLPGRVIAFYVAKLCWPANLTFIYPRWTIDPGDGVAYLFPAAVLAGFGLLWWSRQRGLLAAALLYAGTLFPVLGFVNVYPFRFSFVADHFQYAASLAPLAVAGAAFSAVSLLRIRRLAVGAVLAACAVLTWNQSRMYRDVFTLYRTTLARNPACWMAHNNLAEALTAAGKPGEAIPHLERALQLKPDAAEVENNLGDDLRRLGRAAEAIPHLERALLLQPRFAEARNNLGVALVALGRLQEGKAAFAEAVRLKPDFALARFNLGLACANAGELPAAVSHFREAVRLQPNYAEAELNLGIGLLLTEGFSAALPHFERALHLDPHSADAHQTVGRAFAQAGRREEAVAAYRESLRLNPANPDVHYHLAFLLRDSGRLEEAAVHFQQAAALGRR